MQTEKTTIIPGQIITVDECMSPWEGIEDLYDAEGAPAITKIIRKPRSIGHEIKAAADGKSKILIYFELQEGKVKMQQKPYFQQYGSMR